MLDEQSLELPHWLATAMPILLWGSIIAALLWALLSFIDWRHRKAYNLTVAERSGGSAKKPSFLSVDHEKRRAAMAGGQDFDAAIAARAAAEAPVSPAGEGAAWARLAAIIGATLSLITSIVGALMRVEWMQANLERIGAWDRFVAIVSQNKLGFILATMMILAVVVDYVLKLRKP